jgi:aspartate aminotransferase
MKVGDSASLLSKRAHALKGQSMFQIMMRAHELESAGRHVVHFEIGDPDYSLTTRLANVVERELREDNGHYVSSQGLQELLQVSSERFGLSRGFRPGGNQLLVTPGANIQIFLILTCIADAGDQVLVPNPGFVTYREHCYVAGVEPVYYSLRAQNNFEPELAELQRLINPRVKAIILNSPHNPTGAVYSEETIREIFKLCQKNNVFVISDEVYSRQVFSGAKFFSPSSIDLCDERVFVVHSLSKTFGLTGWRIGVLTGPARVMASVRRASEAILSCVPPFIQVAAAAALKDMNDAANQWVDQIYSRKLRFCTGLSASSGIELFETPGTFYCFGRLTDTNRDSIQVAQQLLEERYVAVVPGDHFGSLGEGYLRFALTSSDRDCELGIERLAQFFARGAS